MGLDMYLTETRSLARYQGLAESDTGDYAEQYRKADAVLDLVDLTSTVDGGVNITATVMYWRKANAIHRWFVENVQDGSDDCQAYYLETEQLRTLQDLAKLVLNDHSLAQGLLPTQEGFCFGGTDYDKWYFKDLESTVAGINTVLENAGEYPEFEYRASW